MTLARTLARVAALVIVAALAPIGVLSVAASPPTPASGNFTYTSCTFGSAHLADGNTTFDVTCTASYTGTLTGNSTLQGPLTIYADGSTNFHGFETFTGTVAGAAGTLTINEASTGNATSFRSTDVVIGGTGGLADLHGVLTLLGSVPPPPGLPSGTYVGQIHFDGP